jgi:hypothetical protein
MLVPAARGAGRHERNLAQGDETMSVEKSPPNRPPVSRATVETGAAGAAQAPAPVRPAQAGDLGVGAPSADQYRDAMPSSAAVQPHAPGVGPKPQRAVRRPGQASERPASSLLAGARAHSASASVAGASLSGTAPAGIDARLQALQEASLRSATAQWQDPIWDRADSSRERRQNEAERAARIGQYDAAAATSGGDWCGHFVGFNLRENGFQHAPSLASVQKARDFFLYRSYTELTGSEANEQLDGLRDEHRQSGDSRQFFVLEESMMQRRVRSAGPNGRARYGHYDIAANTFDYRNLPIRPGDMMILGEHVGMVESYDPATGRLTTLEGNTPGGTGPAGNTRGHGVARKTRDLSDPEVRRTVVGFGRPALSDFAP